MNKILKTTLLLLLLSFKGYTQTNDTTNIIINNDTTNTIICNDTLKPSPIINNNVILDDDTIKITFNPSTTCYTDFKITPILVRGNTERKLINLTIYSDGNPNCYFIKQDLILAGNIITLYQDKNINYRFGITTINNNSKSKEVKTKILTIK